MISAGFFYVLYFLMRRIVQGLQLGINFAVC